MKTIILATLLALGFTANAQTNWAYSTNLFSGLTTLTNVYVRENTNEAYSDTYQILFQKINANNRVLNSWNNFSSSNQSIGSVGLTNGTVFASRVQATNFWLSAPRWVDALVSGLSLSGGSSSPTKTSWGGTWRVVQGEGFAYSQGDSASFVLQSIHVMATTNAAFPNSYYEPHIHIAPRSLSTGSNVTFVMEWQTAIVFGNFTNSATIIRTNTYTFTNKAAMHGLLSFGNITNNEFSGKSSVLFRGAIKRIASPSGDVGTAVGERVFVDSLDFHLPVRSIGSAGQYSGED